MKRISAKLMILPIVVVLILFSLSSSITAGQACGHDITLRVQILSAQYGDYDFDGIEDDIQIIFDMELINEIDENRGIFLFLEIWKPSGTGHMTLFYVWMNSITSRFYINAYNTATEPGWYYASLTGYYFGDGYLFIAYSGIVFDPPGSSEGPTEPNYEIGEVTTLSSNPGGGDGGPGEPFDENDTISP